MTTYRGRFELNLCFMWVGVECEQAWEADEFFKEHAKRMDWKYLYKEEAI